MTRRQIVFVLAVLLAPAILRAQTVDTLTAQEKAQGWQLLFDGKTLEGWHSSVPVPPSGRSGSPQTPTPGQTGTPTSCKSIPSDAVPSPGGSFWEVIDGALVPCSKPAGYLTSDRSFRNFVLSVEFKTGIDTNSGVFVRSPHETGGYEVQIWRRQPAGYNTGSIVNVAKTTREYAFKPDQWNRYEITADGDHLVVVLNGETTLDIHDSRFAEGNVRLQYQMFPIAFRNIKIRPLP